MEIIKQIDSLELVDEGNIVEEYNFSREINFSKLMEFLLSKNMEETLELNIKVPMDDPSDAKLVQIIQEVIKDYNKKVNELAEFNAKISR